MLLINEIAKSIHDNAKAHGFWDDPKPNLPEKVALIHGELSEFLEGLREPRLLQDKHCKDKLNIEIELADAIIRLLDLAKHMNIDIEDAIIAKHAFNCSRPHKHNKKF